VFEMPVLGYGGYVPFSWSIYQLLGLWPVGSLLRAEGCHLLTSSG